MENIQLNIEQKTQMVFLFGQGDKRSNCYEICILAVLNSSCSKR